MLINYNNNCKICLNSQQNKSYVINQNKLLKIKKIKIL